MGWHIPLDKLLLTHILLSVHQLKIRMDEDAYQQHSEAVHVACWRNGSLLLGLVFVVVCFVFYPRSGFSDRDTFRASTDWEPVRGSSICLAWFCVYLFLGLRVWFSWGFFTSLDQTGCFLLVSLILSLKRPQSLGRCPTVTSVPSKNQFLKPTFWMSSSLPCVLRSFFQVPPASCVLPVGMMGCECDGCWPETQNIHDYSWVAYHCEWAHLSSSGQQAWSLAVFWFSLCKISL